MAAQLIISPSSFTGTLRIPSSKSQTLRAILFGAMASGRSTIQYPLDSADARAMIEACILFGAKIDRSHSSLTIEGLGGKICGAQGVIDVGNSGLALRLLAGVAALGVEPIEITGDASIRSQRPMADLLQGLSQLGVQAVSLRGNGFAPLTVKGAIQSGATTVSGEDSQPVSSLLIASALSDQSVSITVTNPGETPWIDLTLCWLDRFGVEYTHDQYRQYHVNGIGSPPGFTYQVPGDLSSCAFPVAAALVTRSTIIIDNVDFSDPQGDKALFGIFQQMGAALSYNDELKQLTVDGSAPLHGIKVDINPCIDAIVALAVVACYAEGETVIRNGAVARQKECDRISAVAQELTKMGATITERPDGLVIRGSTLTGTNVWSHHDHRMAMGLAVAGMGAQGSTVVADSGCIGKTYPSFVKDLSSLGANISEEL